MDVAVIVAVPVADALKVIGVPEATPDVALSVPIVAGETLRFTVFVNAPVPVTVGVQVVVCAFVIEVDVQLSETPVIVGGTTTGLIVTVAVPVMFVYPVTVDAAVIVTVVVTVIDEEGVKTPPDVIVPAVVGVTLQVTVWLGLLCPDTTAVKVALFPTVTVTAGGVTATPVTVVVVWLLVLPEPPQPVKVMVKAPLRQIDSPSAMYIDERCKSWLPRISFSSKALKLLA